MIGKPRRNPTGEHRRGEESTAETGAGGEG